MNGFEMTPRLRLTSRALQMSESRVAEILTWADEPELIRTPGRPVPTFAPVDVAAARLRAAWIAAGMLNRGELAAGDALQRALYGEARQ